LPPPGTGTFQPAHDVFSGTGADSVLVADANHDGRPDLVANPNRGVLLGNGDGSFGAPLPLGTGGPVAVVVDVNGDTRPDLLTSTSVLLGNGDGSFQAPLNFNASPTDLL